MKEIYEELFINLPKCGPGSEQSIRKAYKFLDELPEQPKILDIGCGTGMQTIELAKLSEGRIYAIDIFQSYLDKLLKTSKQENVHEQIQVFNKSMKSLDFDNDFFDVIWSESSIFIIGFEKGLKEWKKFLKKKGYLVISELIWFKEQRPLEVEEFWAKEYPDIKLHEENLQIIETIGYNLIATFNLKDNEWWENLYNPLEKKMIKLKKKYDNDPEIKEFLEKQQKEIDLFRKYSNYYGYCYYILRK